MNNRTGYAVKCGDEYIRGFDLDGPLWTQYRSEAAIWQNRAMAVDTLLFDCVGLSARVVDVSEWARHV
jgi:hypothetical protein